MQKQQKRRKKEREEEEEEIGDASSRYDRSFNNDRKYPKKKKRSDLVELLRTVSWDWGGEEVDRGELLLRHE